MLFENADKDLSIASSKFNIDMARSQIALESECSALGLFYKQAKLKVCCESGTAEDYDFLCEEADEGFIMKAKEVITKIIDAIGEFFSTLKNKIIKMFAKKDIDSNLDAIEKKIRLNPFVKNKKVKLADYDKQQAAVKEYNRTLNKLLAKAKAGANIDSDDIKNEKEKFNKAWTAALAATVTIAVVALIAMVKKNKNNIESVIGTIEEDANDRTRSARKVVEDMTDPQKTAQLTSLVSECAKTAQLEAQTEVNALVGTWCAIKNAVSRGTESEKDMFEAADESSDDDTDLSKKAQSVYDDYDDLSKKDQEDVSDAIENDDDDPDLSDDADDVYDEFLKLSKEDREDVSDAIDSDDVNESMDDVADIMDDITDDDDDSTSILDDETDEPCCKSNDYDCDNDDTCDDENKLIGDAGYLGSSSSANTSFEESVAELMSEVDDLFA